MSGPEFRNTAGLELCKVLEQAGKSVDWRTVPISLVVWRRITGSEAKARYSAVCGSGSILIQGHFVATWNVSSEYRSSGWLRPVVHCCLACRIILRLGCWQFVRDVGHFCIVELIRTLTTHFRRSLIVWLSPVCHRPILSSTAPRIPDVRGRRDVIFRARDVGVTGQQVWRRNVKPSAAGSTISWFMDWSCGLRALCTVD